MKLSYKNWLLFIVTKVFLSLLKPRFLFGIVCMVCALPVLAQDWYVGGKMGLQRFPDLGSGVTSVTKVESLSPAAGMILGMYWDDTLRFEGGVNYLGNVDLKLVNGGYDASNMTLSALYSPFDHESLEGLYFKAGAHYFYWNANGTGVYSDNKGVGLLGGFGYEKAVNDEWSLRVEYEHTQRVSLNGLYLGLTYQPKRASQPEQRASSHLEELEIEEFVDSNQEVNEKADKHISEQIAEDESKNERVDFSIYYAINSSVLTSQDIANLQRFYVQMTKDSPELSRMLIKGFADGETGSLQYNQNFALKRAQVVAGVLRAMGNEHFNVEVEGEVIYSNATHSDNNRRVTLTVYDPDDM